MADRPLGLLSSYDANKKVLGQLSIIESFDFQPIKKTIVDKFDEVAIEIGDAWLNQHSPMKPVQVRRFIDVIEKETKKFLSLRVLHPKYDGRFVPSRLVDRMWHQLIVDTHSYFDFCNKVYGEYLHHQPARPSSIAENAGHHFAMTKEMLTNAYGGLPPMVWGSRSSCDYQACMSGCFD